MNDFIKQQYENVITGLCNLQEYKDALKYFKEYSYEYDDLSHIGGLIYDNLNNKELAIEYYEKSPNCMDDWMICSNLYRCYAELYLYQHKEEQLKYVDRAYELNPDEKLTIANKLIAYGRFELPNKVYYEKLRTMNPEPIILFTYGCCLIRDGNFIDGWRLYRNRVMYATEAIPVGLRHIWNPGVDLTDKTLLVACEQGFGDTMMFIRFINEVKKLCKHVKIMVQDSLYDLIKYNYDYEIYKSSEVDKITYDYFMLMMDIPVLIGLHREQITQKDGYFCVPQDRIDAYKHINSNKLKIGICFAGNREGKNSCRDMPLEALYPLFDLDAQFYCFQKDDIHNEIPKAMEKYSNLENLGPTFNTWMDTACAMKHLDLMISTDCGVLNLAGALGIKTFGLFNRYAEWRWFNMKDNVGWYNIKPFKCKEVDEWEYPISLVRQEIEEMLRM